MIYLAIDDAIATGYALVGGETGKNPVHLASGVLLTVRKESYIRQVYRLLRSLPARPTHACVEAPFPAIIKGKLRNLKGFARACGMHFVWVDAIYDIFGLRAEVVYPSEWQTITRHVIGTTAKERSLYLARQVYHLDITQHDQADALCMAYWMHQRYGFLLTIDDSDPKAGIKRALNTYAAKKGQSPMLWLEVEK